MLNKTVYPLAICLSALAGCVDAIGFLQLGGYFISFMSGNTTRFAVSLAVGDVAGIALLGGIITLFVIGAMLGALARHFSKKISAMTGVLLLVTFLLGAAALSYEAGWHVISIVFMAMAMGAENAVLQRNGDVIGLTYMTGTLVKVGQRLAGAMLGGAKFAWLPYLLLWFGLVSGGVAGTILFSFFGLQSIWIAVLWAGGLTIITTLLKNRFAV